ncbi:MAG: hypothetical protein WD049_10340 [Candidatus Paceibacterota bacterium]
MKKSILITSIVLLTLTLLGIALYFYLPIGEVNPETGEVTTVRDYFPIAGEQPSEGGSQTSGAFGQGEGEEGRSATDSSGAAGDAEQQTLPALRRISEAPIAGATVFAEGAGTSSDVTVRFVDRAKGHVLQASIRRGGLTLISSETLSQIYRAEWLTENSALIQQIQNSFQPVTQLLVVNEENAADGANGTADVYYYPEQIDQVAPAPGSERFAMIELLRDGGSALSILSSSGDRGQIFTHPITEWQLDWPSEGTLTLTTKPGHGVNGYLYTLDTTGSTFRRLLGDIPGLTALLSPDETRFLYSESTANRFRLRHRSLEDGSQRVLGSTTLPEKCVWSSAAPAVAYCAVPSSIPAGTYPDDWYQGRVHFADALVRLDLADSQTTPLIDLSARAREDIDAVDLFLGPNEEYLFFTNKNDGFLWSYRLDGTSN